MMVSIFLFSICVISVSAYHHKGHNRHNFTTANLANCVEAGHQRIIYVDQILGLWKVVEVIEHSERYTDRRNYLRTVAGSESCPRVHFAQKDDELRTVRMLWNEEGGYIQFEFRMTNINNPGFWLSNEWQTGTLVDSSYNHFSGTVQVMKAVQSHLVLTFCSPQEKHFSVILARNYLSQEEIRGVHKQLSRINLPLVNIQSYCNSGVLNVSSLTIIVLAISISCRQWMA
ncbi:uncharacterized protein LOC128992633 isoform X3 [Macrosteles quadrilineatus]|uniref:uncharacterized protein LOC128992633 isoform X3 n=1 Tax=Macrosteles quadrilineatus TaxID=74068 RepID=UPI0023E263E4|nr:uncharacterized protein LOC128992633 isoform X3 [Macrosteles quadrilineatus]